MKEKEGTGGELIKEGHDWWTGSVDRNIEFQRFVQCELHQEERIFFLNS